MEGFACKSSTGAFQKTYGPTPLTIDFGWSSVTLENRFEDSRLVVGKSTQNGQVSSEVNGLDTRPYKNIRERERERDGLEQFS